MVRRTRLQAQLLAAGLKRQRFDSKAILYDHGDKYSDVDAYTITGSSGEAKTTSFTYNDAGKLTITKAPLTVTSNNIFQNIW